ncbi:MAG TPA: MFS transporter [Anaerolineaceae bacterium]|nr:MFS transporter [Anaerolineaceae bacterium]
MLNDKAVKNLVIKKAVPLGAKVWASIIIFGFMGQITWAVENSYFSTYIQQRITAESWATSATVIFSAIFATVASIIGGAISDRIGKRRPFVCWGYFVWGLLTMAFAFFGDEAYVGDAQLITSVVVVFVLMDALMSFVGSMANDAAYSAWVTDVTDVSNRSYVDTIVGLFPLFAMVVILVGFSGMANSGKWSEFFLILGAVPSISGLIGLLIFRDSPTLKPSKDGTYLKQVAYGFKWENIKANKMIYVCFLAILFSSLGMQIWMPYMISIIIDTLQIGYVLPILIVILASSLIAVIAGKLMDKYGKDKFFYPVVIVEAVGGLVAYLTKFVQGQADLTTVFLIVGGTMIMSGSLMIGGLFMASARDYMPEGRAGCFQGIKMILCIMLPMVLASFIDPVIIKTVALTPSAEFILAHPTYSNSYLYPHELFLWAGIFAFFVLIPTFFVKRDARHIRKQKMEELHLINQE